MRFPDDVPVLTDGDVTLRAHRIEDAPAIVEQCTDPISIRWTTVPLGYDLAMAETWVTKAIPPRWENDTEYLFAIETTHPDGQRRFSGTVSLRLGSERQGEVAFGAHPAARGRGVMTTAIHLLLDYGFDVCHLETIVWYAVVGNLASRRVAWKTGFAFGGVMRKWLDHRGEMLDAWVATLHRDDERSPRTPWYDVPELTSDHAHLRPLRPTDAQRIVEGCADPRTQEWLEFLPSPYTIEDAVAFLHQVEAAGGSSEGLTWAVADPQTDRLMGVVGIPRGGHGSHEIGYWAHPDARGRGMTTEAVRLLLRHMFVDVEDGGLGTRRAYVRAAAGNAASQRVATTNGFTECGRERQAMLKRDGSTQDMVTFDLLADEWPIGQGET